MANLKTKSVAILYNPNGTCKKVLVCTHISDDEYKKLYEDMVNNDLKEERQLKELKAKISELELDLEEAKHEIKVLKGEE